MCLRRFFSVKVEFHRQTLVVSDKCLSLTKNVCRFRQTFVGKMRATMLGKPRTPAEQSCVVICVWIPFLRVIQHWNEFVCINNLAIASVTFRTIFANCCCVSMSCHWLTQPRQDHSLVWNRMTKNAGPNNSQTEWNTRFKQLLQHSTIDIGNLCKLPQPLPVESVTARHRITSHLSLQFCNRQRFEGQQTRC
jgi:hypothetical protein